ncbi:MAG: hypothetical protein MOB07_08105 [Acidobacteria bacterium]|nr:hypothetical protein [Acidobacteriota bacterium]
MSLLISCLIADVVVAYSSAGLCYVRGEQNHFKVPEGSPVEGAAELRVVYEGRSNSPVKLPSGQEIAKLSFEEPIRVGGPIWVRVELPNNSHGMVQYPVGIEPGDLGCHGFEVRQSGVLLPRIVTSRPCGITGGLPCGNIGIPGHPMKHPGRLPLHLQYRFETPGAYEVRYTRKADQFGPRSVEALYRSAWTRMEVKPKAEVQNGPHPQDPAEILSDFLPSILGFSDEVRLPVVLEYLYHPEETIRQYAACGLSYWPEDEVRRRLRALVRTKGPSDVIVDRTLSAAPELAEAMLAYLGSDNAILVRGAVTAASRVVFNHHGLFSAAVKTAAEEALLTAAEHIVRVGDEQTKINFTSALGGVHNERSHRLLWDFVQRRVAYEPSLIAITWHKDLKDLPRLAAILDAPATGDPLSSELSSLPYALRNAYGVAALPVLEAALKKSGYVWVRTSCARELIIENRPSGFAFVADAIERNRLYKSEMIEFVRGRFPELRGADDTVVLAFLKRRTI